MTDKVVARHESVELLAKDADVKGSLGFLFHKKGKWFIRWAVNHLAKKQKKVIDYKKEKGWIHPEIALLYEDLTKIISVNEYAWTGTGMPAYNKDRELWQNMRDIMCTLFDEDSYYLLRFFYFLELTFDHRKEYDLALYRANAYINWPKIKEEITLTMQKLEKLEVEKNENDNSNNSTGGNRDNSTV